MDFQPENAYIQVGEDTMPAPFPALTRTSTAAHIREMAARHHVKYEPTQSDLLANDITRLSGDTISLDEIEQMLIALQRAGHITRNELVHLQARYLRERETTP
jgi:hypothetical protein